MPEEVQVKDDDDDWAGHDEQSVVTLNYLTGSCPIMEGVQLMTR